MMQQGMGDMQGKMKELEVKYKDQPDVLMKESMKLMKTGGM
jgi:membrane protein insertase Oxa1/YidC/SpoIIIJ